jgi:Iron/manganese superoxide dismutases, alpha-hairpin domain/Domain of unknown function (DUF6306)
VKETCVRIDLPELPYPLDALEPYISTRTLQTHHGKHHRAYVDKVNALIGESSALDLLNRGQGWVARRIAEALPRIPPSAGKNAWQEMHQSHLANIALCEQLLA